MEKSNKPLLECSPYSKQHLVFMEMTDLTPAQTLDVVQFPDGNYSTIRIVGVNLRFGGVMAALSTTDRKVMNLSPASAPSTSEVSVINVHCRSAKVSVEPI